MTTWGVPLTREEGQSQRLAAAFWSDLVNGEEDKKWFPARQKQRLPAALRTTNSRIDGAVHKLEKLPSSNEEQTTCEDAVEEVCTPSAESTSLQLNGLLSFYQTQLQTQLHPENAAHHILCEMKSELEIGEDDGAVPFAVESESEIGEYDGSVPFAEDMNMTDSD